jgi:hypothetical protein
MTVDEALDRVERLLEQGRLTKVQELVFRQSWAGRSYMEIARSSGPQGHRLSTVAVVV